VSTLRAIWRPCILRLLICSISNATLDLLMMAAWSLALESFHGESIPVRAFHLYLQYLSLIDIPVLLFCSR